MLFQAQTNLMEMKMPVLYFHLLADSGKEDKEINDYEGETESRLKPKVIVNVNLIFIS